MDDLTNLEKLVNDEYKISNLIEDFGKDCIIPNDTKSLSTINLNTGWLLQKWSGKKARTKIALDKLKIKLDTKENSIKQKCRYDTTFNKNRIIDKNEMIEKIAIDEEYIQLKEKIATLNAIYDYLDDCVDHFRYRNGQIENQINIIKFQTMAY